MSIMGTYNVRALESRRDKRLQVTVRFLDDTQHVFEMARAATGQTLLDAVFAHLDLVENEYFGLACLERDVWKWIDAHKSLKRQICGCVNFKVKFFPADPNSLLDEYTRYHVFLQIRRDLITGRMHVPQSMHALLLSYVAQSEMGDYEETQPVTPNATPEFDARVRQLHALHVGLTPAEAEMRFLDRVSTCDAYGCDFHVARDARGNNIEVGVCARAICVFHARARANTFPWAKILKVSFKRRRFCVQLRRDGTEQFDSLVVFTLGSYRACKALWKSCVEHHTFFRLSSPKPTTRKFFFFFSLGSTFRYSGKTEVQTRQDSKRRFSERSFTRTRATVPIKSNKAWAWPEPESPKHEITITLTPDEDGKFGFNVKGGKDQNCRVLVSRVGHAPLREGDHVTAINGVTCDSMTHNEIVALIRASQKLSLTLRPNSELSACQQLRERLNNGSELAAFDRLPRVRATMLITAAREHNHKNRYRDIVPYDATRVKLNSTEDDYINASHVQLEGLKWIASQGPTRDTCADFWTMVWEQRVHVVVMVTPLQENGRDKCHKYWDEEFTVNQWRVTQQSETTRENSIVERVFVMSHGDEELRVTQLQFCAWNDHDVPEAKEFDALVARMRALRTDTPLLVHCSAGIGRTGVLIVVEAALNAIEQSRAVQPLELVKAMRDQRPHLVQTRQQYAFACETMIRAWQKVT